MLSVGCPKLYGVDIIIGEKTRIAAGEAIIVRRLDRVAVYGRSGGLASCELLGLAKNAKTATPEWVRTYEAGLAAYEDRRWSEAIGFFEATAAIRSAVDRPSEISSNDAVLVLSTRRPTIGCRFQCWNRRGNLDD